MTDESDGVKALRRMRFTFGSSELVSLVPLDHEPEVLTWGEMSSRMNATIDELNAAKGRDDVRGWT